MTPRESELAADWADTFDAFRSAAEAYADALRRGEDPNHRDFINVRRLREAMTVAERAYWEFVGRTM